jgi:hypothetical protein
LRLGAVGSAAADVAGPSPAAACFVFDAAGSSARRPVEIMANATDAAKAGNHDCNMHFANMIDLLDMS